MQDELYHKLCQLLTDSGKMYDTEKIKKAYLCAKEAHKDQKRISGEPYINHPLHVSYILVELGMDTDCICAALLHDVVEDTDVGIDEIKAQFGEEVAALVDGVTKLGKIPLTTKEQQQAENVRKMLMAMNQDIRVIIIKLADRLHNMRTLQYMRPEKQLEKSLETLEVYAPIANRLGIRAVKEELEDLSLRFLDPVAVKEIEETLAQKQYNRISIIESIKERIRERLMEYHIEPHIEGRVKSLYGIYRKVYMAGREFDEVYDIFAVRIIVNTDIECYNILGIIHDMFTPIPNRFKDYISTPKPNMYQSLHTTVLGKEGIPFEIQIRTWDMHYTAEYGIAAHWKYKEGISGKDKLEDRLAWIRQIIEAQKDSEGAEDIVRTIKTDLTPEEVYAFTPKGDVKSLPAGSTVVDFAYAIHSEVGNKMIGAKVDGRIVSLDHKIKTGQIIEILTTKSITHGPNKEWLNIAHTSEARSKIRAWFKRERREENIIEGKMELEKELKRNYIHLSEEQYQELLEKLCRRYNHDENDLYAAIGYGGINLQKIMPRIKEDYVRMIKNDAQEQEPILPGIQPKKNHLTGDVAVEGIDNCLVKFAQCCAPLPGDEIIGFITRGHGVSVHKKDCINVINSMRDPQQKDRWIPVYWTGDVAKNYNCTLEVVARDRDALFADVSLALANLSVPIHEISARQLKNGNAIIMATISTQGVEHLKNIMYKIGKINGVISVERSGK
jgi:guanosine-3',5'-bis(diphosphate) 3'-pyrophosphohydrolase